MTIADRRRALMGAAKKPWEVLSLSLGDFGKPANTASFVYNSTTKTLYIKSNGARQYHCIQHSFTTTSGYEYKLEYDVAYVSGTHLGGARKSNNTMYADSGQVTTSKHIKVNFQHNADVAYITLFDTFSVSQVGEMTYSNFSISRRPK